MPVYICTVSYQPPGQEPEEFTGKGVSQYSARDKARTEVFIAMRKRQLPRPNEAHIKEVSCTSLS